MVCVFVLLSVLLTPTTASLSTSMLNESGGAEPASPCPARWLLVGQRCFAFYPVWSSWSTAESMCSQAGSNLASLHTPEEWQFIGQLTDINTPVWLGGYQAPQDDYWFWSDRSPFMYNAWANQRPGKTREGGTCMEMTPKSGELNDAPCGELRFYICSTRVSSTPSVFPNNTIPVNPVLPGVSMCDVLWGPSDVVMEEVLWSSSLVAALRSGRLSQRCSTSFHQQEAVYLYRVSSTLQALINRTEEPEDIRSLLLDTHQHYSNYWSTHQNLLSVPPSKSVRLSLQSFHSVVLEDPVYWLVVLSARALLRSSLARELFSAPSPERSTLVGQGSNSSPRLVFRPRPPGGPETNSHSMKKRSDPDPSQGLFSRVNPASEPRPGEKPDPSPRLVSGPPSEASSLYQQWKRDSLMEEAWADRYMELIEKYRDHIDVFKAINIFRVHMMNQKSLYMAVSCVSED